MKKPLIKTVTTLAAIGIELPIFSSDLAMSFLVYVSPSKAMGYDASI